MKSTKQKRKKRTAANSEQGLYEHFAEIRLRLALSLLVFVAAFGLCYVFAQEIFNILIIPLERAMEQHGGTKRMIFTSVAEGFIVYLKLAGFGGFVLSFPFFVYQIWRFLAPGLYKGERRIIAPFLVFSPLLFVLGGLFVYFFILPLAWNFLLGFQSSMTVLPIELEARISEYLSLVTGLMIAFGISFQLPVVLILLVRFGILSVDSLRKFRRFAIVIIFTVAAFITPPDVISQIGLAIPLLLLYEAAILISGRKTETAQ